MESREVMGAVFCIPHQPTADQMKTPVQSVENPKGLGGVIIYDQETLTMDSHNLVAVCDDRGDRGKKLPQTSSVVTTGEAKKEKCLTRP